MLTYQPINTDYKQVNLDEKCEESCLYFKKIMNANRGFNSSKKTTALYFSPIEKNFLTKFLKLNNVSFSELLRYIYLMDGAMPVPYIKAIQDEKMVSLNFVNLGKYGFDTSYFEEYSKFSEDDFEKEFTKRGSAKTTVDRAILMEQVNAYRKEKGYNTMSSYIKTALIQLVYPLNAREIAKSHIRLDYGKKLSDSDLKKKKTRQEKNVKTRTIGYKNPQAKPNSFKMNISTSNVETDLFKKFQAALKEQGITFSSLVKYRLIQENIISRDMVRMTDRNFKICSFFSYVRPKVQGNEEWYIKTRRERDGEGRQVNNVSITTQVRDAIYKEMGKGSFSKWVKINVLNYYGMYPGIKDKSILEIILHRYRKLKH